MQFGLEVIQLVESLPRGRTADMIGGQLLRAGTAAGANYRSACRAKSPADFISKMGTVEEELDESIYWMEMLVKSRLVVEESVKPLVQEGDELLAITVSSINTARGGKRGSA
jgi:four helix bundle protein